MANIATICARGGSIGVPHKNIKKLQGKPLIAHSIEQAKKTSLIDHVYVSTDDPDIAAVAKEYGAEVPFLRPAELAMSTSPKIPAIEHLVDYLQSQGLTINLIIDLDPTSPLRSLADIETCIRLMDEMTDVVITAYESDKNPYFNMIERKSDGNIRLVKQSATPINGRQQAPTVYSMNASIYVWRLASLVKGLWDGRVKMHIMPRERSIDIDTEFDFAMVEWLLNSKMDSALSTD